MEGDDRRLDALSGVFLLAREMRRHIGELMAEDTWAAHRFDVLRSQAEARALGSLDPE